MIAFCCFYTFSYVGGTDFEATREQVGTNVLVELGPQDRFGVREGKYTTTCL